MRVRNIFSIILINIFLFCMVSVVQEYLGLQETFQRLNMTFNKAVDTASKAALTSEEMFSNELPTEVTSRANSIDDSRLLYATAEIFRGNTWITGNLYIMSMYYNQYGTFPTSQTDYDMYANGVDVEKVYEYLFGMVGSDYSNSSLSWANESSGISILNPKSRTGTNNDFLDFYNKVGKYITKDTMVKVRNAGGSAPATENIPVLTQMGLKLNNYNEVTSQVTADNFTTSYHLGNGGTKYFLTPHSLGVTYIPTEILKPAILTHLELLIRLNKCKGFSTSLTAPTSIYNEAYASADGCIDTTVYNNGSGGASTTPKKHKYNNNTRTYITGITDILNDGRIEYDMSTLQVKVDYFIVDFYDDANYEIVNYIEGATPYSTDFSSLPTRLKNADTSTAKDGKRVVAKITAKIKLHIPYQSSIIQWFIEKTSTKNNEHYDIPLWNDASKNIVLNSDGVWYEYSTYQAVAR